MPSENTAGWSKDGRYHGYTVRMGPDITDHLPSKFTDDERAAYQKLYDWGCTGWTVDLVTKEAHYIDGDRVKKCGGLCQLARRFESRKWDGNLAEEGDE